MHGLGTPAKAGGYGSYGGFAANRRRCWLALSSRFVPVLGPRVRRVDYLLHRCKERIVVRQPAAPDPRCFLPILLGISESPQTVVSHYTLLRRFRLAAGRRFALVLCGHRRV